MLLFDLRNHGASDCDGSKLTMGIKEHADVIAAYRYCVEELGFHRIVLYGTSVGAASSVLAAARIVTQTEINVSKVELAGVIAENGLSDIVTVAAGLIDTALVVHRLQHSLTARVMWPGLKLARMVAPLIAIASLHKRCIGSAEVTALKRLQAVVGQAHGTDIGACLGRGMQVNGVFHCGGVWTV